MAFETEKALLYARQEEKNKFIISNRDCKIEVHGYAFYDERRDRDRNDVTLKIFTMEASKPLQKEDGAMFPSIIREECWIRILDDKVWMQNPFNNQWLPLNTAYDMIKKYPKLQEMEALYTPAVKLITRMQQPNASIL